MSNLDRSDPMHRLVHGTVRVVNAIAVSGGSVAVSNFPTSFQVSNFPSTYTVAQNDTISSAVRVIASEHSRIHEGQGYIHSTIHTGLANNASYYHLLKNPAACYPHLRSAKLACTGAPFHVELFEDSTISADGTLVAGVNMNRTSANVADLLNYHAPTVTTDGTLLSASIVNGDKQIGGMSDSIELEFILKPSTNYLIKVTNKSGQTEDFSLDLFWYES